MCQITIKIKPIDSCELFKIKSFNDEMDSILKFNFQTEETVYSGYITE